MKNYYEILEISSKATSDDIKKAFRTLAKKYHPDTNINDKTLEEKFQTINEAYRTLSDENLRKKYDEKFLNNKQEKTRQKDSEKKSNSFDRNNNDIKNNMDNLKNQFEQFFGFNPNSKEVREDSFEKNEKNPIDTSEIFYSFFKTKKK